MTHDWKKGATILTAGLSVCSRCETLRVTENGKVHFIRRQRDVRDERIVLEEPPCEVAPPRGKLPSPW
jgi:hypothetical protein